MTDIENVESLEQKQPENENIAAESSEEQVNTNQNNDEIVKAFENLKQDYEKINESYIRTLAEMDNLRKRTKADIENNAKFAISSFAKEMLAVADNLERAIASIPKEAKEKDENLKNLLVGVEMTAKELGNIFEKNGITRIETENKPFNPHFEQAVQEVEDANYPTGTVIKELQAGYTINGRILREAMVIVSKGGLKPEENNPPGAKVDTSA